MNRVRFLLDLTMYDATEIMHTNKNSTISRIPIMIPVATSESNPEFVSSAALVGITTELKLADNEPV